jgi:hypothetical protein
MDESRYAILRIVFLVGRIFGAIYCSKTAGELNRNKTGWGVFGFFLPIIAVIWIQFMKPIIDWKEGDKID